MVTAKPISPPGDKKDQAIILTDGNICYNKCKKQGFPGKESHYVDQYL